MDRFIMAITLALAAAARVASCQSDSVDAVYDRFADSTGVHMYGIPIRLTNELPSVGLPPDTVNIFASFSLAGRRQEGWPASVSLRFAIVFATFGAADPSWRFADDRQGTILLDGTKRLALGTAHYEQHHYGARAMEYLFFDVPTDQFVSLAKASTIEGRIGGKEFALDARALAWLRLFSSHVSRGSVDDRQSGNASH